MNKLLIAILIVSTTSKSAYADTATYTAETMKMVLAAYCFDIGVGKPDTVTIQIQDALSASTEAAKGLGMRAFQDMRLIMDDQLRTFFNAGIEHRFGVCEKMFSD